ncbi:hypothetical protein ST47_g3301 [Ascochyta rabiei]|uniref:Uncharacterized protein n=1 Tax=Didymella rabiei TaxID=5454 RepID=A0A163I0G5_DIDRA|nr:hypothetical protein ST47_g3301 [Ascochyta rabiei]
MENSRASGTYATRVSSPPTAQQRYHAFPQKRNSYRRPADARPQPKDPDMPTLVPTLIPSNTARPVAPPASNGAARPASHRCRQSQPIPPATAAMAEPLPAAPEVPRAPPTSYKDPYARTSSTKGPPRSSRDPTIQLNTSRQQPTIQTAAGRLYELRSPPYAPIEPLSGSLERRNSQRKPSVPDRSPLQKLEGKLDDISKEERRARMLEAELAAQERVESEMRARRAREAAEKERRIVSQPVPKYELTPDNTQHTGNNKRRVSAPLQSNPRSPDTTDLDSEDGYVYDLTEPWNPSAAQAVAVPAPHRIPSQKQPRLTSIQKVPHTDTAIVRNASIKGKEPASVSRGVGSFKDRIAVPVTQPIHRKPVEQPIGSLTPLSGLGLEDAGVEDTLGGAEVIRSDSRRKSSADPYAVQEPARRASQRDSRGIMAARMEMQQQQNDQKGLPQSNGQFQIHPYSSPVPPVARKSVGFSDVDSDIHPQTSRDAHHRFSRHQGPERTYVRPPMLEEWRQAPIATLISEDLDLNAPARTPNTANKTWWEEGQAGRRRRSGTHAEPSYDGYADGSTSQTSFSPPLAEQAESGKSGEVAS